jgi:hypothetical protein
MAARSKARSAAALLPAAIVLLGFCSPARAGGDFVDLTASPSRVWFVGEPGVRELDANTGRTLAAPTLTAAAYPLSVALAGGAAWVASVQNGYVWGTLTRINTRTGHTKIVWRRANSSVQYVAAGAGSVWALIGSSGPTRIARFTLAGQLRRSWTIPGAGRMAADSSGCWISTNTWLIHIDPHGRIHRVIRAQLGDVATGAGSVWLPQTRSIIRVEEASGRIRALPTTPLRLGGFQHDLAASTGALWLLTYPGRSHTTLQRLDPNNGHLTGHTELPGIADAVVATPTDIWVATIIAPPNRPATGYEVLRLNPRTLHRRLLVHLT